MGCSCRNVGMVFWVFDSLVPLFYFGMVSTTLLLSKSVLCTAVFVVSPVCLQMIQAFCEKVLHSSFQGFTSFSLRVFSERIGENSVCETRFFSFSAGQYVLMFLELAALWSSCLRSPTNRHASDGIVSPNFMLHFLLR